MSKEWPIPDPFPVLADNEVHLWVVNLSAERDLVLSFDEQKRAERYKIEKPRQQFAMARTGLRLLLSNYLNSAPTGIRFMYADHGKPWISHPETDLQFNVSHSQDYALIGFTQGHPIGVDIEWLGRKADVESLTTRFYSDSEQSALAVVPSTARHHAFLDCWVQKEAYLKSLGSGLSRDTRSFSVSVSGGLIADSLDSKATAQWKIDLLTPAEKYTAAVSTKKPSTDRQLFRID